MTGRLPTSLWHIRLFLFITSYWGGKVLGISLVVLCVGRLQDVCVCVGMSLVVLCVGMSLVVSCATRIITSCSLSSERECVCMSVCVWHKNLTQHTYIPLLGMQLWGGFD